MWCAGMGGIMRAPNTLFWILLASVRVFWKSVFGWGGTLFPAPMQIQI